MSVTIQYFHASITRLFRSDFATADKWSIEATIQKFEKETSGVLLTLNDAKFRDVDRRVMGLQKEVSERLSDIQCGLEEVWTSTLQASIFAY